MSPGWWDLVTTGATPELSIAVGSIHVTDFVDVPEGAVSVMGAVGQPVMTGGMLSVALTGCVNFWRNNAW